MSLSALVFILSADYNRSGDSCQHMQLWITHATTSMQQQ